MEESEASRLAWWRGETSSLAWTAVSRDSSHFGLSEELPSSHPFRLPPRACRTKTKREQDSTLLHRRRLFSSEARWDERSWGCYCFKLDSERQKYISARGRGAALSAHVEERSRKRKFYVKHFCISGREKELRAKWKFISFDDDDYDEKKERCKMGKNPHFYPARAKLSGVIKRRAC